MRKSIASRLATLYALMLSIIVLFVILASSIVLVYKLGGLTGDIMISKHEEARILVEQYRHAGLSLKAAAPHLVEQLGGIGLRVAVFDDNRRFLAGDPDLRPRMLDEMTTSAARVSSLSRRDQEQVKALLPKNGSSGQILIYNYSDGADLPRSGPLFAPLAPKAMPRMPFDSNFGYSIVGPIPHPSPNALRHHESGSAASRFVLREILAHPTGPHGEPTGLAVVNGGFVAFAPSLALISVALVPYWKFIISIAVIAIVLAWFLGWQFSRQALRPLHDVSQALHALAAGEYSQQRFVLAGGDEMESLTSAYNDAAANVAAAMDERRRTEERMRQFVADAGHELRTPLTVIAGYIDVLRRGAVEEPTVAKQILATMSIEKEHMRSLIDRLMRLARLDAADTLPNDEPIDVAELLRSQCEAARRLDAGREIDYSVSGATQIRGDRAELGEALWNIVENALKYAPGAPIHLRAFRENGKTAIVVQDEGPGMSDSERIHAFERFYRGDTRGEITGSGLGLAIAKRAVERAGGEIRIDSSPGHGTSVTLQVA